MRAVATLRHRHRLLPNRVAGARYPPPEPGRRIVPEARDAGCRGDLRTNNPAVKRSTRLSASCTTCSDARAAPCDSPAPALSLRPARSAPATSPPLTRARGISPDDHTGHECRRESSIQHASVQWQLVSCDVRQQRLANERAPQWRVGPAPAFRPAARSRPSRRS
jgi:hypothetical protein